MSAISRRTALGIAAAGVVAAAAGATAVGSRACGAERRQPPLQPAGDAAVDYVDRDGWMMTPAEGERLAPTTRTGS